LSSIIVAGDTSGTVTLAAPAVAGTTTLTLPATTGTVALTASPTFTGQATIPTINLTGGQITFPATQSASADANTLDDYEEGSWTPALKTPGTATYTQQVGRYIKIGKFVFVKAHLQITTIGTGNGAEVSGLPYLPAGYLFPITFGYWGTIASSQIYVSGYINPSADTITFTSAASAGTTINNGVVLLTTASSIHFSAWYEAAS